MQLPSLTPAIVAIDEAVGLLVEQLVGEVTRRASCTIGVESLQWSIPGQIGAKLVGDFNFPVARWHGHTARYSVSTRDGDSAGTTSSIVDLLLQHSAGDERRLLLLLDAASSARKLGE
jgi:hypothetical protein